MNGLFSAQPGDDGLPPCQRRPVMLAIVLATIITMLDTTMVNIALPTIARELGIEPAASIWVAKASLLASATAMLSFAALGDVIGFKRVFTGGLIVFTLASLGSACARTLPALLLCRTLQGFGAAAVVSICPALLRVVFPSRLLGSVFGVNALVVAGSAAFGPTAGGLLLSLVAWPWLFAITLPFGAAALWLARSLPADSGRGARLDAPGAAYSALAMGAAIIALDSRLHPAYATRIGAAALALAALVLFIVRQRRAAMPLLPLGLFASRRFSVAAAVSFCSFVSQGIAFVVMPFLFQGGYGYGPLQSALLFSSWPLAIILAAPWSGRLADIYPAGVLSTTGLLVLAAGLALFASAGPDAGTADLAWRVFVCGVGFGFFQSPNNRELLGTVDRSRAGAASGVLALVRTFGQTVGMALVSIVLSGAAGASAAATALWIATATAALACLFSASRLMRNRGGA